MHHEISLKVNDSSVLEAIYFGISGSARRKQVKFIFGASSHYLLPFVLLCENPHTLLSTSIFLLPISALHYNQLWGYIHYSLRVFAFKSKFQMWN